MAARAVAADSGAKEVRVAWVAEGTAAAEVPALRAAGRGVEPALAAGLEAE